ncbi:leucine-rich repeat neuronal protein 4 [Stegastes partitus]|uniref:Leucine-rich repeat neuronal protein 4 n=2 Tax=Stegastes partitus TaxID=144197 RepID=A0A9Y4JP62_9TELE|nr:PREDICTED: leucine-rich repeat neuronal protein 4-like [Stegastes partitus]
MAAMRDLPFPFVLICLVFIRGYCPLPTTSQVTEMNPTGPVRSRGVSPEAHVLPPEDYYEGEETTTPIVPDRRSPDGGTSERCDYNPCSENQTPCAELAAATNCLCPGLPSHDDPPETPSLRSVSWNGSEVVLHWCAPNSHVTEYVVTVGGQDRKTFGKEQRSGALGDINNIAEVCVVAVNDAGNSDGSCMMYRPVDNSLPLKAGLIGGALGFLLLLLLAVLLWRRKRQRKQEASISMHNTAGTQ